MRTLYFLGLPFLWCKGVKRNLGEFVNGGFSLCCPAYGRSDFSACYSFLILILYYFPIIILDVYFLRFGVCWYKLSPAVIRQSSYTLTAVVFHALYAGQESSSQR